MTLVEAKLDQFLPVSLESEGGFQWAVLSKGNALDTVGAVNRILNAAQVAYLRTWPDGTVDHFFVYELRNACRTSSVVQFHTDPERTNHWVTVTMSLKGEDDPAYVTIQKGQSFFVDPDERFVVIRQDHWFTNSTGPARGEEPQTRYEFYVPVPIQE